jgi:LCP family protein required for cell wall assembly
MTRKHNTNFYGIAIVLVITAAVFVLIGGVIFWQRAAEKQAQVSSQDMVTVDEPTSVAIAVNTTIPTNMPLPPTRTFTPTYTVTPSPTSTPSPTITLSPTASPTLTYTPTASLTPTTTSSPVPTEIPTMTLFPSPTFTPDPNGPQPAALRTSPYDLFNVLLLGNDERPGFASYRTDVIVIASVNRTTASVNLLSFPRDLYVYIPGYGYDRINTASVWGSIGNWPGGGIGLLKDTIRHNFGIQIDAYARVNFNGFEQIVDAVGGIDLLVDCGLSDYRLIAPNLNPDLRGNWELYNLAIGRHHVDGATALWYARSRATTSDFDRNRRHQMLLRAIWSQFNEQDLWDQIPELWEAFSNIVDTDLSIEQILSFAPIGLQIDPRLIENHFIGLGQVEPFTTAQGAAVLRMNRERIDQVITQFYTPPTENRLFEEGPRIGIRNRSGVDQVEFVAIERLSWEGFAPVAEEYDDSEVVRRTVIYDYTGITKGSSLTVLQRVLGVPRADVIFQPNPDRTMDYRVVLGESYDACTYDPWQSWAQVN